jgi:hypothetical protein
MKINKTSRYESDITDDVFVTDTTKRGCDARESDIFSYDKGFCRRENYETRLTKPYQNIKNEKQSHCTCHTWSSYLPILRSNKKKKMLNQYVSTPNMYESTSSTRLDMIAFCHQIPRVSLVRSLSCSRHQDDRDQETYSGEEEDMAASLRQEERKILDTCTAYGEEKERGMDIYEVQQPCTYGE